MSQRQVVGVIFGGVSVEHEVSVITAHEVMSGLPEDRFLVVPIYVAKSGTWFAGPELRRLEAFSDLPALLQRVPQVSPLIDPTKPAQLTLVQAPRGGGLFRRDRENGGAITIDVLLPVIHGSHGEDGALAGLCEMAGIAYCGCGVTAGALSMDKPLAKHVWRSHNLPVLDDIVVTRERYRREPDAVVAEVLQRFGHPVFVKPATLGSSVGVSRADDEESLRDALELAYVYCGRVLIEPAQQEIVEINCSVLGRGDTVRSSVLEQPVSSGLLSYADKYASGATKGRGTKAATPQGAKRTGMETAQRIIPAPVDEALSGRIRTLAERAFTTLGCAGVARVDFLVRPQSGEVIINEINTVPGALAFYLWEATGVSFSQMLSELVDLGVAAAEERRQSQYSIDGWLLDLATGAGGGAKSGR